VRTYSRKGRNQQEQPQQQPQKQQPPSDLKLVPPCHASLVGLRGLTLHNRYLLQIADPSKMKTFKYRPDTDETLKQGIFHPDVLIGVERVRGEQQMRKEASSTAATDNEADREVIDIEASPSVEKADELLLERFKALFFWPCMMSTIK
jgi:hypothetical protein